MHFSDLSALTTNSIKVPCAKAGVNAGNFMLNGFFPLTSIFKPHIELTF